MTFSVRKLPLKGVSQHREAPKIVIPFSSSERKKEGKEQGTEKIETIRLGEPMRQSKIGRADALWCDGW